MFFLVWFCDFSDGFHVFLVHFFQMVITLDPLFCGSLITKLLWASSMEGKPHHLQNETVVFAPRVL